MGLQWGGHVSPDSYLNNTARCMSYLTQPVQHDETIHKRLLAVLRGVYAGAAPLLLSRATSLQRHVPKQLLLQGGRKNVLDKGYKVYFILLSTGKGSTEVRCLSPRAVANDKPVGKVDQTLIECQTRCVI